MIGVYKLDRDVRFGIVGCGAISPWHANGIAGAEGASLVAVCDCIREKAEKLAGGNGHIKIYTDYSEMLGDPNVDAVCICTPSGMHADMAVLAAKAGKHVLSEKPADITLENIDRMIAACREANVKLGVIFQRRTSRLWRAVKKTIESGGLGRIVLGDAYCKYFRGQKYYDSGEWRGTWHLDGGGALMNQGVHIIDMLRWIMGPVDTVFAYTGHLVRNIEVEDTAVAAIKFANGAFGVLEGATSVNPGLDHRVEFHGEKGTIRIEGEKIVEWSVPGVELCVGEGSGGVDIKAGTSASSPTSVDIEGHLLQIEDLASAIREDRAPLVTGEEARKAVEVILAIYKSSKTGMPVTLPLE